ncbi:NmrA/HSCARG family protein [Actinosynnema sp. NPDC020468]|uniref:NmrA/HSCARG family protein n=1 Tax=Actinosynnema sp. NPDC020468 TaxID=3154488 RepID=UPI0033EAEA53
MSRTVLVTGATGSQGGSTARALLEADWSVRALVRDVDAPAARLLAERGATLVRGDQLDRASLDAAVRGVDGVFSVQPTGQSVEDQEAEVRMGVNVADAAHAAGVRHLVYTSVGGVESGHGPSFWDTKLRIERHLTDLGLPTTVLRPVMFMENHLRGPWAATGELPLIRLIPAGASVQLIAVRDIGVFAALAFGDPGYYVGRRFDLAGDRLDRADLVAALEAKIGRALDSAPLPPDVVRSLGMKADDQDRAKAFESWQADIPALRAQHPGLLTFRAWLDTVSFD